MNLRSRATSVLLLLSLGATAAVGIGVPVAGVFTGGTLKGELCSCTNSMAVLLNVAVILSYGSSLRLQKIVQAAWLAVAVICLAFAEYILSLNYSDAGKAADTVLLIVMFCLAFPAGTIAVGLTIIYSVFLSPDRPVTQLDLVVLWLFFFVIGYLQWFRLTPFLITQVRVIRGKRTQQ